MHKSSTNARTNYRTNAQHGHTQHNAQMPLSERGGIVCANASAQMCRQLGYAVEVKIPPVNGWTNIRVIAGRGMDSRRFVLGWNGQRLARGAELARLAERFPDELESVTEWLEAGQP